MSDITEREGFTGVRRWMALNFVITILVITGQFSGLYWQIDKLHKLELEALTPCTSTKPPGA